MSQVYISANLLERLGNYHFSSMMRKCLFAAQLYWHSLDHALKGQFQNMCTTAIYVARRCKKYQCGRAGRTGHPSSEIKWKPKDLPTALDPKGTKLSNERKSKWQTCRSKDHLGRLFGSLRTTLRDVEFNL